MSGGGDSQSNSGNGSGSIGNGGEGGGGGGERQSRFVYLDCSCQDQKNAPAPSTRVFLRRDREEYFYFTLIFLLRCYCTRYVIATKVINLHTDLPSLTVGMPSTDKTLEGFIDRRARGLGLFFWLPPSSVCPPTRGPGQTKVGVCCRRQCRPTT